MSVHNSFYDFCDCLGDALDVLVDTISSLDLYIGEIHLDFWWLFGASIIFAVYNTFMGYADESDINTFQSNYNSGED